MENGVVWYENPLGAYNVIEVDGEVAMVIPAHQRIEGRDVGVWAILSTGLVRA